MLEVSIIISQKILNLSPIVKTVKLTYIYGGKRMPTCF